MLYASNMMNDDALKIFNKIIESDPRNPSALNNIGNIYYISGDYNKAVDYYSRASESDPYDANILMNISRSYVKAGKNDDAKLFFNKAISMNPELKKYSADILK
jgi:tetratricopeptide (TPR) repeat protein